MKLLKAVKMFGWMNTIHDDFRALYGYNLWQETGLLNPEILHNGLQMAMVTARQAAARGMTPTIALLTDGRANIALSGDGNRSAAREDAGRMADLIRAEGIPSLVLDTARRPAPELRGLSDRLAASYIVLPRADARGLSDAVTSALGRS